MLNLDYICIAGAADKALEICSPTGQSWPVLSIVLALVVMYGQVTFAKWLVSLCCAIKSVLEQNQDYKWKPAFC
jgi:hypothetical protein